MPEPLPISPRLLSVKTAIRRLAEQRLRTGSGGESMNDLLSDLKVGVFFNVSDFNRSDNTGIAKIEAFTISHGTNLSLIAMYEKQPGLNGKRLGRRHLEMVRKEKFNKEIHFWFHVDNRWMIHRSRIGQMK